MTQLPDINVKNFPGVLVLVVQLKSQVYLPGPLFLMGFPSTHLFKKLFIFQILSHSYIGSW